MKETPPHWPFLGLEPIRWVLIPYIPSLEYIPKLDRTLSLVDNDKIFHLVIHLVTILDTGIVECQPFFLPRVGHAILI